MEYWKATYLKISRNALERLQLFAAATSSPLTATAIRAFTWTLSQQRAGKWEELAKLDEKLSSTEIAKTSIRIPPDLKEEMKAAAAAENVRLLDFMRTAIWGYTNGVDSAAEIKYRGTARKVVALRETEMPAEPAVRALENHER